MTTEQFDYARYLADKKSIDDVSLNADVQARLLSWLVEAMAGGGGDPLRILEAGAGIGTMLERLLERLPATARPLNWAYTAVEREARFRNLARDRLQTWSRAHDFSFIVQSEDVWRLESTRGVIEVTWRCEDILGTATTIQPESIDLLVAHAVLDLLPVPRCLPSLLACLTGNGAYYFSLNYAGETCFEPAHSGDSTILDAYHADMDSRLAEAGWRSSRTGLLLGQWLAGQGHAVIAEGDSDWQLPSAAGGVVVQFMGAILDTIDQSLAGHSRLPEWLALRRRQLADGILVYRAANRDYFGLKGRPYMGTRSR